MRMAENSTGNTVGSLTLLDNSSVALVRAVRVAAVNYDLWREVYFVAVGVLTPVGLVLNTLALLVFVTSWMRRTVPGRYFIALAIADNLVLTGELLDWLNSKNSHGARLGFSLMHSATWMCRSVNWLRCGARMWSSWVTVAITIERFLTVTRPLKMAAHSNPRKATIVCVVLFAVCFTAATYTFSLLEALSYHGTMLCGYVNADRYHIFNILIIGIFGELLVPSAIVLGFTILIIRTLTKARHLREEASGLRLHRLNHHRSHESQPTIALVAIATMFVLVRLPYTVVFILNDIFHITIGAPIYIVYKTTKFVAITNYVFNFLLFCLSGTTFRKQLVRFFTCRCRVPRAVLTESTRSKSISQGMTHFEVIRGKGRSASVDILCHVSRRVKRSGSGKATSVERLQTVLVPMATRSASADVDVAKLFSCQRTDVCKKHSNCLQSFSDGLRSSSKAQPSLTSDYFVFGGSIPFMDEAH